MLSIDISHAVSFLSLPYEAALRPRLERAAGWLQNVAGLENILVLVNIIHQLNF